MIQSAEDATKPPRDARSAPVEPEMTASHMTSASTSASQRDQNIDVTGRQIHQSASKTMMVK